MLTNWLVQYWLQAIFGLILAGMGLVIKFILKTLKKDYVDVISKNQDDIKNMHKEIIGFQKDFDEKFDKLNDKIHDLAEQSKASDLAIMRDTLLRKIRNGLQDGCITQADLETVASLIEQYEKLGGNGEIHRLYDKYILLPVCVDGSDGN